jgi:hypothetical protein
VTARIDLRCALAGRGSLAARGKSPPGLFPGMKTSGFHGSRAPGIASLRSSRLFVHSLLDRPECDGARTRGVRGPSVHPDAFSSLEIRRSPGSFTESSSPPSSDPTWTARVPSVWRRHPTDRVHHGTGTDPENPHVPRRTARAASAFTCSGPAHRLGRAPADP